MKILITGGSGLLGKELLKINPDIIAPDRVDMDVREFGECRQVINKYNPDLIIHAAALTDDRHIRLYPEAGLRTNIFGSANIAIACYHLDIRMVYISTDYIYSGKKGNYSEQDEIDPVNQYAWTKLGGECAVRMVKDHLIIRTSFGATDFPYKEAFVNQITSKDYVDIIAPIIYKAAISKATGVMNIGTAAKSIFDYAFERNNIAPGKLDISLNHSLNLNRYKNEIG